MSEAEQFLKSDKATSYDVSFVYFTHTERMVIRKWMDEYRKVDRKIIRERLELIVSGSDDPYDALWAYIKELE